MISTWWGIVPLIFFISGIFATYTNEAYDHRFCTVYYTDADVCFQHIREQNEQYRPYIFIGLIIIITFMLTAFISNNFLNNNISIKKNGYGIYAQHKQDSVK